MRSEAATKRTKKTASTPKEGGHEQAVTTDEDIEKAQNQNSSSSGSAGVSDRKRKAEAEA